MSSITEEYIKSVICHVAAVFKLTKWEYQVNKFENIGQNYFGVIVPVTLSGSEITGHWRRNAVVLKLAPTEESYRISGAVTTMFRREMFVYSVLLKKYEDLQDKLALIPQFIIPTLYFIREEYCKEVIAMRNMQDCGYKPYTHETYLDLNHITLALESLARFHALSFILKETDRSLYEEVVKVCMPLTENSNKRYMDVMRDRISKALHVFEGTQYGPLLQNLLENCGKLFNTAVKLASVTCICHGDVWKENILFQYEPSDKEKTNPRKACLIDYQTTRESSPAFDALYLIISSTNTLLRKDNFSNLLNIYYETLKNNIEKADCAVTYCREDFDHDLKIIAPACLIVANTALWLSNGLQEEGHVRSKIVLSTPEEKEAAVSKYRCVVKAIIDDFYICGYLGGGGAE